MKQRSLSWIYSFYYQRSHFSSLHVGTPVLKWSRPSPIFPPSYSPLQVWVGRWRILFCPHSVADVFLACLFVVVVSLVCCCYYMYSRASETGTVKEVGGERNHISSYFEKGDALFFMRLSVYYSLRSFLVIHLPFALLLNIFALSLVTFVCLS